MRNEDYDRELLAFVTLFSVVIAIAIGIFDTSPSAARGVTQASVATEQTDVTQVRVVGTPFVPNTKPSAR